MTTIRRGDDVAATPGKAAHIALWTLQVLVAMAVVAAGSGKLLGTADMIALFQAVGIGQWFRYVTGLLEVLGALVWFSVNIGDHNAAERQTSQDIAVER